MLGQDTQVAGILKRQRPPVKHHISPFRVGRKGEFSVLVEPSEICGKSCTLGNRGRAFENTGVIYLATYSTSHQPYRRSPSSSANQSSCDLVVFGVLMLTIVDLLCESVRSSTLDSCNPSERYRVNSQACSASIPFSLPIPLSFMPPLQIKNFSRMNSPYFVIR